MQPSSAAIFRSRYGEHFHGRIGILGEPGVDLTRRETSATAEEVADPFGGELASYRAIGSQIDRLLTIWAPEFRGSPPRAGGRE